MAIKWKNNSVKGILLVLVCAMLASTAMCNAYPMFREKAQKIMDCFIKDAEKTAPDKATHQMEWVGHMNNARNSAEEVINQKLIYAIR